MEEDTYCRTGGHDCRSASPATLPSGIIEVRLCGDIDLVLAAGVMAFIGEVAVLVVFTLAVRDVCVRLLRGGLCVSCERGQVDDRAVSSSRPTLCMGGADGSMTWLTSPRPLSSS